MVQFELLANELLLDLFEYLNTASLIHVFFNLNSRFNQLVYTHFRNHEINFQSIGNEDFDRICEEHLPLLIDEIISLRLSNNRETPNLCEIFLCRGFTLDRFSNLKMLTLHHIDYFDTLNQMIIQCHSLIHLTHLNLIDCDTRNQKNNTSVMINNIWTLAKLTHCNINNLEMNAGWVHKLSIISSSIECLSIKRLDGEIYVLHNFFKSTPSLQRLNIDWTRWRRFDRSGFIFSSIISLKTMFQTDTYSIEDFLKRFPNLCYLTLETENIDFNGYQWEELILNYLPKLKTFHLKMNFRFPADNSIIEDVQKLVDSFRTPFWVETHQWYVRCDAYPPIENYKFVSLYTLPYVFKDYSYDINLYYWESTKPDEKEYLPFHSVQLVEQRHFQLQTFNDFNLFNRRFPNIRHFEVTFPLMGQFSSYYLSFNQLTSVDVQLNDVLGYKQLQMLLDQSPQLYSLKLRSFGRSMDRLFQLTSSSIRQLDLCDCGHYFTNDDCLHLINWPLGYRCEVIFIGIKNRRNILDLIEKMSYLRVFIFQYRDITINSHKFSFIDKSFLWWLRKNLPSTSSIIKDRHQGTIISVWINRKQNFDSLPSFWQRVSRHSPSFLTLSSLLPIIIVYFLFFFSYIYVCVILTK